MQLLDFPKTFEKSIFTLKVQEGFVGCVVKDNYVCITKDTFESALQAANKARNLNKLLSEDTQNNVKKTTVKTKTTVQTKTGSKKESPCKPKVNSGTNKEKSQVRYSHKLYTLFDVKAMPLLRFQEVWVITYYDKYVKDCLNEDKKKLVEYTIDKERAAYFTSHEEAKFKMLSLKGVIGPGFDLKRFFIEAK